MRALHPLHSTVNISLAPLRLHIARGQIADVCHLQVRGKGLLNGMVMRDGLGEGQVSSVALCTLKLAITLGSILISSAGFPNSTEGCYIDTSYSNGSISRTEKVSAAHSKRASILR